MRRVSILTSLRDVKIVQLITGVQRETQNLPVQPAHQAKVWRPDQALKKVTVHGVSLHYAVGFQTIQTCMNFHFLSIILSLEKYAFSDTGASDTQNSIRLQFT